MPITSFRFKQSLLFALLITSFFTFGNAAINFTEARVTEVINDVSINSGDSKRPAKKDEMFKAPDVIRTGPQSRAELTAADNTLTRIGSNTIFSFDPASRTINLNSGSILFNSPEGKGGGTIRTASATASVVGTTIMVSATSNGGFKFLVMEGKGKVELPNGTSRILNAGQLTFIAPGSTTISPSISFDIKRQTQDSKLVKGFSKELPSLPKVEKQIDQQQMDFRKGRSESTQLTVHDAPTGDKIPVLEGRPPIGSPADPNGPFSFPWALIQTDAFLPLFSPERLRVYNIADVAPLLGIRPNPNDTFFDQKLALYFGRNIIINPSLYNIGLNKPVDGLAFYAVHDLVFETGGGSVFSGPFAHLGFVGNNFLLAKATDITFNGAGLHFDGGDQGIQFIGKPATNTVSNTVGEIDFHSRGDIVLNRYNLSSNRLVMHAPMDRTISINDVALAPGVSISASNLNMEAGTITFKNVTFANGATGNFFTRSGNWDCSSPTATPGQLNFIGCSYGVTAMGTYGSGSPGQVGTSSFYSYKK